MADVQEQRLPAESDAYRQARNRLLTAEKELRKQVESVAALRRGLPPGGKVKEEYVFEEGGDDLVFRSRHFVPIKSTQRPYPVKTGST